MIKTTALVCAGALLGGGSWAAAGSYITSNNIANGTIKCVDLKPALCEQIKAKPQVGPRGPQGVRGATGPQGPVGPQGPPGRDGRDGTVSTPPPVGLPPETQVVSGWGSGWSYVSDNCLNGAATEVSFAQDGLVFGPLPDAGARAVVTYTGFTGAKLSDLDEITYTVAYDQAEDRHAGAPTLRILTADLEAVIDFHPQSVVKGEQRTFTINDSTPVYLTSGGRTSTTYGAAVAAHGDREIGEFRLDLGCVFEGATEGVTSKVSKFTTTIDGNLSTFMFSKED